MVETLKKNDNYHFKRSRNNSECCAKDKTTLKLRAIDSDNGQSKELIILHQI